MSESPNPLAALEATSGRRSPLPRHPRKEVTYPKVEPVEQAAGQAEDQGVEQAAEPTPAPPTRARRQERTVPQPVVRDTLKATQLYLDADAADFLFDCTSAGMLMRTRAVTQSAVMRYALEYLSAHRTPQQVAETIVSGETRAARPAGRPRA
ncbi:hypothetical protein [Kineococcus rhizosphaerae]|uniref:Uncharacterized protein n=1 Tax=Kineococcus rhizosphaerae TaxID=559628 RepID=A0A2T0QTM8_9ACTN|nr:hypothetical protein [Kineococcus rhizosphaerae]PRY08419.1 hypothetical protein CLV37_12414 [Kineococcus rhizosphaerae]